MRQTLWGGWTCDNCGIEMDKFGTDISSSVESAASQGQIGFNAPLDEQGRTPVERVFEEKD